MYVRFFTVYFQISIFSSLIIDTQTPYHYRLIYKTLFEHISFIFVFARIILCLFKSFTNSAMQNTFLHSVDLIITPKLQVCGSVTWFIQDFQNIKHVHNC